MFKNKVGLNYPFHDNRHLKRVIMTLIFIDCTMLWFFVMLCTIVGTNANMLIWFILPAWAFVLIIANIMFKTIFTTDYEKVLKIRMDDFDKNS